MSKKQQERKKKLRKEIAKKRVLARRKVLRKHASEDLKASRLEKKFRNRIQPVIKDEEKRKMLEQANNEKILSKLEKNAQILKALESEYLSEVEGKKHINEQLEAEGHVTFKEKMDALNEKAKDKMTEEQKETGIVEN